MCLQEFADICFLASLFSDTNYKHLNSEVIISVMTTLIIFSKQSAGV